MQPTHLHPAGDHSGSSVQLRPRIYRPLPWPPEEVMERLQNGLEQVADTYHGYRTRDHFFLTVPQEDRHYWSPQLDLRVEPDEQGRAILRGLCGPRPSIWLQFVFFYTLLGFIAMIIAIMGFSQLNLGLRATILWILPVIGLIVLLMWLSSRVGQRLARDQMAHLYRFLDTYVPAETTVS